MSRPCRGAAVPTSGGHSIWWTVESACEETAVALLPFYVAERTTAVPVSEVQIP